jgi:hypothetical protein
VRRTASSSRAATAGSAPAGPKSPYQWL